jgi:hypothetical protein
MNFRDDTPADDVIEAATKLLGTDGPDSDNPAVVVSALEAIRITKAWQLRRLNNWDWKDLGVTVGLRVAIEETLQAVLPITCSSPSATPAASTPPSTTVDAAKPCTSDSINREATQAVSPAVSSPSTIAEQFELELGEGTQMKRPSLFAAKNPLARGSGPRRRKRFSLSKLSPRGAFSGKRKSAKFGKLKDSGVEGESAVGTIDAVARFSRLSTDLANERTLLAWIRTALAVCRTCFATISLGADAFGDVVRAISLPLSSIL